VIRVAATADVHVGADSRGRIRPHFAHVAEHADVLVIAGDLTKCGTAGEARLFADELADVTVPRVAVLGNHDYHANEVTEVVDALDARGVVVLEGGAVTLDVDGLRVGIAGVKGFGGGFPSGLASEFGEPEMKAFVRVTKRAADRLGAVLSSLDVDVRIAVMHYAPVEQTLAGECREIYPFLGSYLLAEAVDRAGADLVVHGHAHAGQEHGSTPGGVPVRNVAQPVIGAAYKVYAIEASPPSGARPGGRGPAGARV
jgi:Icc-related predicted phosphoesterase